MSQQLPEPSFLLVLQIHHLQAMLQLGMIPNPQTGQPMPVNLDAGRHQLRLLEILQEKTRGNLDEEEENLLGEIIASVEQALNSKGADA